MSHFWHHFMSEDFYFELTVVFHNGYDGPSTKQWPYFKLSDLVLFWGKPISKPIYGLRKTEAPTILRTDNRAISNNPEPNGNSFAKSKTVFSLWQIALDLMASVLLTVHTEWNQFTGLFPVKIKWTYIVCPFGIDYIV